IASHPRGTHLVDAHAGRVAVVVDAHVAHAGGLEHLGHVVHHVAAHQTLVLADRAVDREHRQAPLVRPRLVERYAVVGIGQHLAERGRADAPRPRPRRLVLVSAAETELRDRALPSLPARAALIAEAAQVLAAVAEQIPVAGDVEAGRPAAVVVAVAEALDLALGAAAKVVIHQVAAEHAGAR